ncbi:hypothetical protein [Desulfoluna spongiiphila]|uniref:Uncharacterized protein n=1 Tax=Desulfoluna spongiiphila TaxID=419481 RepID=A0A1G5IT85_9BACT|nr:hypothetical protein [Desulfoluna spongiiphila]SCY78618.1 hypothetical protein SAMN05216233_12191 [Desulfoluna spongiiphila]
MRQSTGLSMVGRFFCLCVMMVLLVASGATAGTFDAAGLSSKELSKAKRLSAQYAKQVDQAEQFVQKNNLSMAGKRLANAERTYNKMLAPYRLYPDVVIKKKRFDELTSQVDEAKALAGMEKSVKTFDKKVTEAQKYLDRRDTKNAKRFMAKALASYEGIPSGQRNRADVKAIHARYEALAAKMGASSTAGTAVAAVSAESAETYGLDPKALKKAKRYASRFEKKMTEADRFFKEKDYAICERRLIDAEKLYVKIGPEFQQDPGVQATKKTFDEMNAIVTQAIVARKEGIEKKNQMLRLRTRFESEVRNNARILSYLQAGRDGQTVNSLVSLEPLFENFGALDTFHATCQEKYTLLLEQDPDREVEGETVKSIFDLAENRLTYRNALAQRTIDQDLASQVAFFNKANAGILEKNLVVSGILNDLHLTNFGEPLNCITKTRAVCKVTGLPVPTEKFEEIKAFQDTFKASVKSVRKKLKFKKSDYPYKTSAMKRVASQTAKSRGMELVYVGMPVEKWYVNKNDLGIPLSKSGTGRGLYHVDGEDFYRGYDVKICRQFNGSGYEPVSVVMPGAKVTIYKK